MIALTNHCAGLLPARCFVHAVLMPRRSMPIPACGPAAQAVPACDVVHPGPASGLLRELPIVTDSKRASGVAVRFPLNDRCPVQAIKQLFRVCGLLIDEAEPICLQHHEPDEMVVQVTSIEDLRWALIAAEKELSGIEEGRGKD